MSISALPLPNGKQQFVDINGAPLDGGTVAHYYPGGLTPKDTWQDAGATIANDNPLTLDERGQAVIWGTGLYRQIVKDSLGSEIWDQETGVFINSGADIILTSSGGPPGASAWLGGEVFDRTVSFAGNFAGSYGKIPKTLPTGTFVVSILKNNTPIGSASCSTLGAWTFLSNGAAAFSFNAADEIDFVGPVSPDATIKDFGLTLAGTFS